MSLMEKIFGNIGAQQPQQQMPQSNQQQQPVQQPVQQPTPGNIPDNAGASSSTNPTVPAGVPGADAQLAEFAELWQPNKNQQPDAPLFGNVDPAKLMAAAQKTDFSKAIPKDALEKINAGGPGAMEAFSGAMNQVAQTVFANNALTSAKLIDQALKKQAELFEAKLPGIIKQHTLSDNLRSENPLFSNPAVQPLISALELKLAQKFPQATAGELTGMAKNYLEGLSQVFTPPKPGDSKQDAKKGQDDWSAFLDA